jgi:hypothetical protein
MPETLEQFRGHSAKPSSECFLHAVQFIRFAHNLAPSHTVTHISETSKKQSRQIIGGFQEPGEGHDSRVGKANPRDAVSGNKVRFFHSRLPLSQLLSAPFAPSLV